MNAFVTHQSLVFNLLPDEFVFTEGISCLPCDGVYGSLLHLLFDGTEQHEQGLASALLRFGRKPRNLIKRRQRRDVKENRSLYVSR